MRCHWFATGILALVVLSADGTLIARGTTRVDVGAADGRRDTGLPGIPDSQADVGGWEFTAPETGTPTTTASPTPGRPAGGSTPRTQGTEWRIPTATATRTWRAT